MAKRKLPTRFVKKGCGCPGGMLKIEPTPKMRKSKVAQRIDLCATPDLIKRKGWKVQGGKMGGRRKSG